LDNPYPVLINILFYNNTTKEVSYDTGSNSYLPITGGQLSGDLGIQITPLSSIHAYNATNPKLFLQNSTVRHFVSSSGNNLDLGNDTGASGVIRFMPDNVEKVRIDSSGLSMNNNSITQCGTIGRTIWSSGEIIRMISVTPTVVSTVIDGTGTWMTFTYTPTASTTAPSYIIQFLLR